MAEYDEDGRIILAPDEPSYPRVEYQVGGNPTRAIVAGPNGAMMEPGHIYLDVTHAPPMYWSDRRLTAWVKSQQKARRKATPGEARWPAVDDKVGRWLYRWWRLAQELGDVDKAEQAARVEFMAEAEHLPAEWFGFDEPGYWWRTRIRPHVKRIAQFALLGG